jgi:hypothetical protein
MVSRKGREVSRDRGGKRVSSEEERRGREVSREGE